MATYALFALLLAGLLAARFRWWLKRTPPAGAEDIRQFSRRLSRTVYLLIYLIIGIAEVLKLVGGDAGLARELDVLQPANQGFLVYGLLALGLIRLFAYLTWRRHMSSVEPRRPPRSAPTPATPSIARPY